MKVEALVQHAQEMVLINETQAKKIKFLQSEKQKSQAYIKDLQHSLLLNKQSISVLAENLQEQAVIRLNTENQNLQLKSQQYYKQILDKNALLLIEQQLRVEEKKFYNERLVEFENKMNQLRKYLQDKEDSFTTIVNRLRKYEDLNEVFLKDKTYQFKSELQKQNNTQVLKSLAEEKEKYKRLYEKTKPEIDKLSILKSCLANKVDYETLKLAFGHYENNYNKEEKEDKLIMEEKTKNTTNASTNQVLANKQLIKLLKKEKLSNQILENALNEAIEKNEELMQENNQLSQSVEEYEYEKQKLDSKIYLLQLQLSKYQLNYKWKSEWKAKCDIDRPQYNFIVNSKMNQQKINMQTLKNDVEEISQFMHLCIPQAKLIKSSSQPRLKLNIDEDEDELQIQQI